MFFNDDADGNALEISGIFEDEDALPEPDDDEEENTPAVNQVEEVI